MNGNEIIATTDHTIFFSPSLHNEVGKWEEFVMTYYDSNNGCIWDIGEKLSTKCRFGSGFLGQNPRMRFQIQIGIFLSFLAFGKIFISWFLKSQST